MPTIADLLCENITLAALLRRAYNSGLMRRCDTCDGLDCPSCGLLAEIYSALEEVS